MKYIETNKPGIIQALLFTLILVGFIVTLIAEGENPLNSLVIVSNAFTSNCYEMYKIWKINSLILVW